MELSKADAELLLEVFTCWLAEDDYDEEGKLKSAEYQSMVDRLSEAAA